MQICGILVVNMIDDKQLFFQLKQGDPHAVEQWFKLYHSRLLKLILTRVSLKKDAEEITQDTFMSCLKHLPLFRGESAIWTWMVKISQHEVADYYRKRYAKKAIHALSLDEFLLSTKINNAHDTSEKVKLVLSQMSQEYREILLMKYVDNKKVKEIAEILERTVKAIESDLFRARVEFRAIYVTLE